MGGKKVEYHCSKWHQATTGGKIFRLFCKNCITCTRSLSAKDKKQKLLEVKAFAMLWHISGTTSPSKCHNLLAGKGLTSLK
jgi:hypothetical protein